MPLSLASSPFPKPSSSRIRHPTASTSTPSPPLAPDAPPLFPSQITRRSREIRDVCQNSSSPPTNPSSPVLRYLSAKSETFAGNFSTQERRSFFNHSDDRVEVPCGFMKEFPLRASDKLAMEKCDGVVVVSAVLGDHDKIRQPKGLGAETLQSVCFFMFVDDATLGGLAAHKILADNNGDLDSIGTWRVIWLPCNELPYESPAMNGVIFKHLVHRLFPSSKFTIWLDAKLQLTVDPLLLIHSLLMANNSDMAVSKHPFNVHTMEEAMATARWKKWNDVQSLRVQMETYCENGLQPWSPSKHPYTTDVPDTALIIRRHGLESNLFSCLLFNELEAFNHRDQLAFAYVRDFMNPRIKINMFDVEVFEHVAIEYRHILKSTTIEPKTRMASSQDITASSCHGYLLKMWGESNE